MIGIYALEMGEFELEERLLGSDVIVFDLGNAKVQCQIKDNRLEIYRTDTRPSSDLVVTPRASNVLEVFAVNSCPMEIEK